MERADILKQLGLDKLPPPRMDGTEHEPERPLVSGHQAIKFRKAITLVDPLETAAFTRYIPDGVTIDQSLDARAFHPELSIGRSCRTDVTIPVTERITRSTGIGAEPTVHNHFLWLASELKRAKDELGFRTCSQPLIFRTSGGNGTMPLLGWLIKVDYKLKPWESRLDLGANLGLLSEKKTPIVENPEIS